MRLFTEAERDAEEAQAELPSIIVASHPCARPVRKPLPAALPRIEMIHDLSEAEKRCAEDGQVLVAIGEEVCEQLDIVPDATIARRRRRIDDLCLARLRGTERTQAERALHEAMSEVPPTGARSGDSRRSE